MDKVKVEKWGIDEESHTITINDKLTSGEIAKIVNAVANVERKYLGDDGFTKTKWEIITENNVS